MIRDRIISARSSPRIAIVRTPGFGVQTLDFTVFEIMKVMEKSTNPGLVLIVPLKTHNILLVLFDVIFVEVDLICKHLSFII